MDIVERLRSNADERLAVWQVVKTMNEAADEIERLRHVHDEGGKTCAIYWNEIQNLREQLGLGTPWFGDQDWWKERYSSLQQKESE